MFLAKHQNRMWQNLFLIHVRTWLGREPPFHHVNQTNVNAAFVALSDKTTMHIVDHCDFWTLWLHLVVFMNIACDVGIAIFAFECSIKETWRFLKQLFVLKSSWPGKVLICQHLQNFFSNWLMLLSAVLKCSAIHMNENLSLNLEMSWTSWLSSKEFKASIPLFTNCVCHIFHAHCET